MLPVPPCVLVTVIPAQVQVQRITVQLMSASVILLAIVNNVQVQEQLLTVLAMILPVLVTAMPVLEQD